MTTIRVRRGLALTAAVLVVLAVAVELAALPVATRAVGGALARCLPFDDVEVTSVARPVLPRLLLGRARDVELEATGLRFDTIRVERARIELPVAALPWAIRPPPPQEAVLELELSESDLQDVLAEQAPFGLRPVVELTPGEIALRIDPLPARVRVRLAVVDGVVRVEPVGAAPAWFDGLGLELTYDLPDDVGVDQLDVRQASLLAVLRAEVVPGVDGSAGCAGPLGSGRR